MVNTTIMIAANTTLLNNQSGGNTPPDQVLNFFHPTDINFANVL